MVQLKATINNEKSKDEKLEKQTEASDDERKTADETLEVDSVAVNIADEPQDAATVTVDGNAEVNTNAVVEVVQPTMEQHKSPGCSVFIPSLIMILSLTLMVLGVITLMANDPSFSQKERVGEFATIPVAFLNFASGITAALFWEDKTPGRHVKPMLFNAFTIFTTAAYMGLQGYGSEYYDDSFCKQRNATTQTLEMPQLVRNGSKVEQVRGAAKQTMHWPWRSDDCEQWLTWRVFKRNTLVCGCVIGFLLALLATIQLILKLCFVLEFICEGQPHDQDKPTRILTPEELAELRKQDEIMMENLKNAGLL